MLRDQLGLRHYPACQPHDLSSKLLWMSPRKAILEHDEASNLELQPGDIVTIFSQRDITVPQTERSQYVIVEGEVTASRCL